MIMMIIQWLMILLIWNPGYCLFLILSSRLDILPPSFFFFLFLLKELVKGSILNECLLTSLLPDRMSFVPEEPIVLSFKPLIYDPDDMEWEFLWPSRYPYSPLPPSLSPLLPFIYQTCRFCFQNLKPLTIYQLLTIVAGTVLGVLDIARRKAVSGRNKLSSTPRSFWLVE